MELLIIVASSTIGDELEHMFQSCGVRSYTIVPQVIGSGVAGGTRHDDDVWPGVNTMYFVAVDRERAESVKRWVRDYRAASVREGLKVFSLTPTEVI